MLLIIASCWNLFFRSVQLPAIQIFSVVPECSTTVGACPSQGEELSVPPPGPHPRTFSVRIRGWNRRQLHHLSLLSSAVLKLNRGKTGASRAPSAVERDGASASALDRRIGRDVPAHLHPTRDRRGAAEAGLPGRRKKYFNGVVVQK